MTTCVLPVRGNLYGFALAADPEPTITMLAGSTSYIAGVDTFALAPEGIVGAQNSAERLALIGAKAGEATLTYTSRGSPERKTARVVVQAVTPVQAIQQGKQVWEKVSNILGEPVLSIDWQDAAAIRANADAMMRVLATLRNAADDWGYTRAKTDAHNLYSIVNYIKKNPAVTTLRQAVEGTYPQMFTREEYTPTGNRCGGRRKFSFLYDFAQGYGTFVDVVAISAVVLAAVAATAASIASLGAAAGPAALAYLGITASGAVSSLTLGATVAGAVATAASYLATEMPTFAADPDRLVAAFGSAVCAAINNNALPRRARFVNKFRTKADAAARRYRVTLAFADATTDPAARAALFQKAATERAEGQAALVEMLGLDDPAFFTPEQNARMLETRRILNAGDQLVIAEARAQIRREATVNATAGQSLRTESGASTSTDSAKGAGAGAGAEKASGGGGGAIVAVGAAAAAFALWRLSR